jgi:hypothetical protein
MRLQAWKQFMEKTEEEPDPYESWRHFDPLKDKVKHLNEALLLDDAATMIATLRETNVNVAAAAKFAESGPKTLEELRVSNEDIGFPSMQAFEKSDESKADDLEKRFGAAPPGCQYHHFCEQTMNRGKLDPSLIHSTFNVAPVPTLFHIGVSAETSSLIVVEGKKIVAREWLRTQPFEEQWRYGYWTLRRFGIIKK